MKNYIEDTQNLCFRIPFLPNPISLHLFASNKYY